MAIFYKKNCLYICKGNLKKKKSDSIQYKTSFRNWGK